MEFSLPCYATSYTIIREQRILTDFVTTVTLICRRCAIDFWKEGTDGDSPLYSTASFRRGNAAVFPHGCTWGSRVPLYQPRVLRSTIAASPSSMKTVRYSLLSKSSRMRLAFQLMHFTKSPTPMPPAEWSFAELFWLHSSTKLILCSAVVFVYEKHPYRKASLYMLIHMVYMLIRTLAKGNMAVNKIARYSPLKWCLPLFATSHRW